MEVTDRTIEDVITKLLDSGNLWLIMPCCFIVGIVIGVALTVLYFKKIRQFQLENELAIMKTALAQAEHERDENKAKYEQEKVRAECVRDMEYAQLAIEHDATPLI